MSTQTITGVVEVIRQNEKGIWSMNVDNVWYGFYKTEPKCKTGDTVTFEAEQKGNFWNAKPATLKKAVVSPTASPAAEAVAVGGSGTARTQTWDGGDKRQDSIIFQSSRKDALEFLGILVDTGVVDVSKVKAADKASVLETYLDQYTDRFVADVKNLGHKAEAKAAKPKVAPPGEEADPDDDLPF